MRCLLVTLALCVPLAAGCGGGEPQTRDRTVAVEAGATVSVAAHEYWFDPSTVAVAGPGSLTLTLRNEGSLAHNLKVLRDDRQVGGTRSIRSGETVSVTVELERGSYQLICTVGDHAELGMRGTLKVD